MCCTRASVVCSWDYTRSVLVWALVVEASHIGKHRLHDCLISLSIYAVIALPEPIHVCRSRPQARPLHILPRNFTLSVSCSMCTRVLDTTKRELICCTERGCPWGKAITNGVVDIFTRCRPLYATVWLLRFRVYGAIIQPIRIGLGYDLNCLYLQIYLEFGILFTLFIARNA